MTGRLSDGARRRYDDKEDADLYGSCTASPASTPRGWGVEGGGGGREGGGLSPRHGHLLAFASPLNCTVLHTKGWAGGVGESGGLQTREKRQEEEDDEEG